MTAALTINLAGLPPFDALEVAHRLRLIADTATATPADRRTAARLAELADALEVAACDANAPHRPDRDAGTADGPQTAPERPVRPDLEVTGHE